MPRSLTRLSLTLLLGVPYLAALAAIAFWPTPVDAAIDGDLGRVTSWFARHGLPAVDYGFIESAANIALFIPLGLLVALNLRPRRAWIAVLVGAVTSSVIELGQLLFLAARFATAHDVLMNTSGAALGAVAGVLLSTVMSARERRRAAEWDDAFAHLPLHGASGVAADGPGRAS
ncbi:VanZ family protein [Rathayibacter tanaceti]|uniref:VanZ family protein n=2 Tax=Rathayibacter tanaceti TaxID=1671680 RepID=A0A162J2Y8_9MICO|nr:VanZ family protein [Rathayibacter tanaceti]KZX21427.1 VanZ like family protein [Rathayibacter tanaceti]QHC54910.1 VanZ family protein [Rathayibacter tanaceti]TCO38447.1 VanZ like protein [Rathayibacter tanaceti]